MDNNNRYEYSIEYPQRTEKKKRSPVWLVSLFLAFTLIVGGTGGVVGYYISQNDLPVVAAPEQPSASPAEATGIAAVMQMSAAAGETKTIQEIFALGDSSTVAISTTSDSLNVFGQPVSQASAGSGFIFTKDGYILTNHHVIDGASEVVVMLSDGTEYKAEIVGSDSLTDLAVLKISASGLTPVSIGDSDKLLVGDQVVAIGNPLGELANSLTVGYISAKKRIVSIDDVPRVMLQTDASVSPGNSGGPLFNNCGQVIGIVSAKTVSSGVEGIGFAIPVNLAADIANELIQNGAIKGRPLLGISYQELAQVTLSGSGAPAKGVYIAEVNSGSAAEKAGLMKGDVIVSFNGERITCGSELQISKNLCRVGDTVPVVVWRSGKEITLSVTFDTEMPETAVQTEEVPEQSYYNPWRR